ncbi:MAG: hypothetical protein ACK4SY_04955 [Pyrobaculum sp.]
MVKITAICSENPGEVEPSHGFGVLVDGLLLFDSCSREGMALFLSKREIKPLVGVVGLPDNPHHVGGFSFFKIPVINPTGDLVLKIRGERYVVLKERENVLVARDVAILPCGLHTLPYHRLSRRGVKARCVVGGLGGTAHSPYLLHRVVAELRLLGVRCIAPIHTAPQFVKELERRFNVYRLSAGATAEF